MRLNTGVEARVLGKVYVGMEGKVRCLFGPCVLPNSTYENLATLLWEGSHNLQTSEAYSAAKIFCQSSG
jgi:hypothetical protein